MTEYAYSVVIRAVEVEGEARATIDVYHGAEKFTLPTYGGDTFSLDLARTVAAVLELVTVDQVGEPPLTSPKAVARAWEIAIVQHLALAEQIREMMHAAVRGGSTVNLAALAPLTITASVQ